MSQVKSDEDKDFSMSNDESIDLLLRLCLFYTQNHPVFCRDEKERKYIYIHFKLSLSFMSTLTLLTWLEAWLHFKVLVCIIFYKALHTRYICKSLWFIALYVYVF